MDKREVIFNAFRDNQIIEVENVETGEICTGMIDRICEHIRFDTQKRELKFNIESRVGIKPEDEKQGHRFCLTEWVSDVVIEVVE